MKKILIMLLSFGLVAGASAQRFRKGGYYGGRPHVVISLGTYAPFYPGFPAYGYSPFYAYPPRYGYMGRPSKLDLEIADIRNDYNERIWSVRHDKNLSRKERRHEIRELKHDMDQAIIDARRNFYNYRRP